jgi:hypothetical protein
MAQEGSVGPPDLSSWAEVDPARYPFDPAEVTELVHEVVVGELGSIRCGDRAGRSTRAWAWIDAVGEVLSRRYGPWAYHWYWAPGEQERLGWITDRIPTPAEAPAFVAESLQAWRRWLEELAGRFGPFLRSLVEVHAAGIGDALVAWEAAIAQVMTTVIAGVVDDDGWQGWCRRVLRWLLTAAGVPAQRAEAMVDRAIDKQFDSWVPVTASVIGDIAQRLARYVLDPAGTMLVSRPDDWPDTWPQHWPSWRATNTGWAAR